MEPLLVLVMTESHTPSCRSEEARSKVFSALKSSSSDEDDAAVGADSVIDSVADSVADSVTDSGAVSPAVQDTADTAARTSVRINAVFFMVFTPLIIMITKV